MADWLSAFLGLAGTAIGASLVFHSQQAARLFQARRDDQQIFRDRAQSVFAEVAIIRSGQIPSILSMIERIAEEDRGKRKDMLPFPDVARLRAILGVYFPKIFVVISDFEEATRNEYRNPSDPLDFKDISATEQKLFLITVIVSQKLTVALNEVEEQLFAELKHLPDLTRSEPSHSQWWQFR